MCDQKQAIDNKIIPPFVTGTLKSSMHKKLNHVFNGDKYYCLFFIYRKQLSLSSYMTVKKYYILKAEQGFLDGVYTEV